MEIITPKPKDAFRIASLITENINRYIGENIKGLKITDAAGYHHYVEDNIHLSHKGIDTRYLVVWHDENIVACTEVRILPKTLLNNYTVKDSKYKHLKVGGRLKYLAAINFANQECKYVIGDVFAQNSNSCNFHLRNGFEEIDRNGWFLIEQPESNETNLYIINDLPQADIVHQRYGFSQFEVITSQDTYKVGRIGDNVFRLKGFNWFNDNAFLTALKIIDPQRRILVIAKEGTQPENIAPLATSIRFRCEIEKYKTNLENSGYDKNE